MVPPTPGSFHATTFGERVTVTQFEMQMRSISRALGRNNNIPSSRKGLPDEGLNHIFYVASNDESVKAYFAE